MYIFQPKPLVSMNYLETIKDKSDQELLTMVYEFNAWNPQMLVAVEQELSIRNILPADLKEKKENLMAEENLLLTNGKQASLFGQVIGWLTVMGFIGIYIGYNYTYAKERSKYTDKVYFKYNKSSRENGKNLFYASLVLGVIIILYKTFARSF